MDVVNIHERELRATRRQVGALIDSLSSRDDLLWPSHAWPPMKFDRPLSVGATGGHGPIRYFVEAHSPGESVRFRFTGPKGFDGWHGYEIVRATENAVRLRHMLQMKTHGLAQISWPLVFRPLHDALIEDSFATAEASLQQTPQLKKWSVWVVVLRWILFKGKAPKQKMPNLARETGQTSSSSLP